MISPRPAQPVQLDPPGPHKTPEAAEFSCLALAQGQLPILACFLFHNGVQLQVPLSAEAYERMKKEFHDLYMLDQAETGDGDI